VANEDALDDKLRHAASLSASLQADVNLEVELPCDASPADEIAGVRAACAGAGLNVASVLCCPAAYLKSYQPSDVWPEVPELSDIYAAARDAFDGSAIGGGMLSYFTELNRKWPPPAGIDFVSHTVSPIVHAADDLTIMENLTTLSAMAATVRERLGNIRYRIGPSAIAMRVNPYGAATLDNPGFRRIAMANADPRECAIFGAAWALGFAAQAAKQGIDQVCLFATSGPQAVYVSADDQARLQDAGIQEAKVKPVFHVLRALAACRDQALIETTVSGPRRRQLATLAVRTDQQIELWITNLGAAATAVALPARAKTSIMNADAIDAVCGDLHWLENAPVNSGDHIELDSFALARCRIAV
jgi:hypothetical protein